MNLLLRGSIEGAIAVLLAALVARCLNRRPGALIATLWWLASLRFLLAAVAVPLPVLDAPAERIVRPVAAWVAVPLAPDRGSEVSPDVAPGATFSGDTLRKGAGIVWSLGFLLSFVPAIVAFRRARRCLRSDCSRLPDEDECALIERVRRDVDLREAPPVRFSREASTPFLFAPGRAIVIVPEERWNAMPMREREMVLAHEFIHVRRRDAFWGILPWVVAKIFWFHPLARWAAREHGLAREIACDHDVLRHLGASPGNYAGLLVSLGAGSPMTASGLAASSTFRSLRRRLIMLEIPPSLRNSRRRGAIAVIAMAAMIAPLRLTDAAVGTGRNTTSTTSSTWDWSGREDVIAFLAGDDVHMTGNIAAAERAREIAHDRGLERLVYFTHSGKEWVIDDPGFQDNAMKLLADTDTLNRAQTELGIRQSELGEKQAALGRRQAELGLEMATLNEEMARLETERQRRSLRDEDTSDIEARLEVIHEQMEEVGRAMEEVGDEQSRIGSMQGNIGREQSAIGERQSEEAKHIWQKIEKLVDEARKDGRAKPIED